MVRKKKKGRARRKEGQVGSMGYLSLRFQGWLEHFWLVTGFESGHVGDGGSQSRTKAKVNRFEEGEDERVQLWFSP